jgi:D-glycero-alpha-D-manno-heptose-7-phosphate kinase
LRIRAQAPTRICDCGGWTDTWFAEKGAVCSLAIQPGVNVRIETVAPDQQPKLVRLIISNFNEIFDYDPASSIWERHPLILAAIRRMGIPAGMAVEMRIDSRMPPGAGTGTSAAVTVAVLAGLAALQGREISTHELAMEAYRVEREMLGQQCGVQDQIAAAAGGMNFIVIDEFPESRIMPVALTPMFAAELEAGLGLVYLGRAHESSQVHELVIAEQERLGGQSPALGQLRGWAEKARDALEAGDLSAYGAALSGNTETQRDLHPDLVGERAQQVIDLARRHGALGYKVNGAGGAGGSVAVLFADGKGKGEFERRLPPEATLIAMQLDLKGVTVAIE